MTTLRILVATVLALLSNAALASMVWAAVAVDPPTAQELERKPGLAEKLLEEPQKGRSAYLDKAWHGIHFLLTGSQAQTTAPESMVIFGGRPIGPDQGYGPAQLLSPSDARRVAKLLESFPPQALAAKFNPRAMEAAKIYPDIIWVREGPEALKYVLQFYAQLLAFYKEAAERGDAVLLVVR